MSNTSSSLETQRVSSQHSQLQDFLKRIWPSEGPYCMVVFKGNKPAQCFVASVEEAARFALDPANAGRNIYHAIATFTDMQSRKGENAKALRCLQTDWDVGENKPYATKEDALAAILQFRNMTGLLAPELIDSGNGIHAYWPLLEPVQPDQWIETAKLLKQRLVELDCKADPSVTGDVARIMRTPFTKNYKDPLNPKPVLQLRRGTPMSLSAFKRCLASPPTGAYSSLPFEVPAHLKRKPGDALDPLTASLIGGAPTATDARGFSANLIADECKQIRLALMMGGATRNEPTWHADIGLLKYTAEGRDACHRASNSYPTYSLEETDRKIDAWKKPPTTCEYYERINPTDCKDCPHKGGIKTPLSLGRPPRAAIGNTDSLTLEDGAINFDRSPPPIRTHVMGEVLFPGKLGLLGGPGGTSKTMLALQIAAHKAIGKALGQWQMSEGSSLVFLGEEDEDERTRRIKAICKDWSDDDYQKVCDRVKAFPMVGRDLRLTRIENENMDETPLARHIIELAGQHGAECGLPCELIVIDHLRLAAAGELNAGEDATQLTRVLAHIASETQAAVLLLAHSPKATLNKQEEVNAADIAHSAAFVDNARSAMVLVGMRSDEAKKFGIPDTSTSDYVRLRVVKSNYGRTGDDIWFRREVVYQTGVLHPINLAPPHAALGNAVLKKAILDLVKLKPGQLSLRKLRDSYSGKQRELKASERTVIAAVASLLDEGLLVRRQPTKEEREKYRLSANAREVLDLIFHE